MGIGFGHLLGPATNGEGFVAKFAEVLWYGTGWSGFNGLRKSATEGPTGLFGPVGGLVGSSPADWPVGH